MNTLSQTDIVWLNTINLLTIFKLPCGGIAQEYNIKKNARECMLAPTLSGSGEAYSAARERIVHILECPTSSTAFVYWSEPSLCHYGHQMWRAVSAPADGYCALSGQQVEKGDRVFRPAKSRHDAAPANALAMILATEMLHSGDIRSDRSK